MTNWCPEVSMPSTDANFTGGCLNKFGLRTQTAGTVEVELNLMCRGAPPKAPTRLGRGRGGLFGKKGGAGKQISLAALKK